MTALQEVADEAVDEVLDNPGWMQVTRKVHKNLRRQYYHSAYVDIIFQKNRGRPTIYDAYYFAIIHRQIRLGQIGMFQIPVEDMPCSDRNIKGNNEILSNLSYPFHAEFWTSRGAGADGSITWEQPMDVWVEWPEKEAIGLVIVEPMSAQLEVGTSSGFKMWFEAYRRNSIVARWPYGQKEITVLVPNRWYYNPAKDGFDDLQRDAYRGLNPFSPWIEWGNKQEGE